MGAAIGEELEQYINVLPVIKKVFPYDVGISVCDCEKLILFLPANNLSIKVEVGSPIKEGTGLWRALNERRPVFFKADKAVRGVSYIACSHPILNKAGEIIGAITIAESTDRYDELKEIADSLSSGIGNLASVSEEVSAQSQEIAAVNRQICKAMKEAGWKECSVIIADNLTEEQEREFIVKDNVGFGDWDFSMLANEWDADKLIEWGVDLPEFNNDIHDIENIENISEKVNFIVKCENISELEYLKHKLNCNANSIDCAKLLSII